jgi:drug/metabolite transporter (DMT)-like permease
MDGAGDHRRRVRVAPVPAAPRRDPRDADLASAGIPALFVLLWSTGFIVARFGLPYAGTLTFLSLRFGATVAILGPLVFLTRAPWPAPGTRGREMGHIAVAGVLLQAGFLSGVWGGIKLGIPAGVSALIVGLQPVLTAVAARWVGEHVTRRQWLGMGLGFCGVLLVVSNRAGTDGVTPRTVSHTVVALLSITAGTLYQKRFCPSIDLRVGNLVQFAASLLVVAPLALAFESNHIEWTPRFFGALAWSVLALSVGAGFLLFTLIRRQAATRVASLFYLTPPVTALLAWALFGEALTITVGIGMLSAAVGVALVTKR